MRCCDAFLVVIMECIYGDVLKFEPQEHVATNLSTVVFKYLDGLISLSFGSLALWFCPSILCFGP